MSAIVTNNFKIQNAINFAQLINTGNYYITIGKIDDWGNQSLTPVNTLATYRSLWDNMIGGKTISEGRTSLVIPKITWTANMMYAMYDDADEDLFNKNFYVVTDELNVYKCLFNNNNGISTVKPTGTGISNIELSDGYIWKFMYSVSLDELTKFDVDNYIPITNNPLVDSNQYIVQNNAVAGTIDVIKVIDGGLGYTNPTISIIGDGTGASAQAVMNGTSIEKIKMISTGKDYTYANIVISSETEPSSKANLHAIIAPNKGHGSNAVEELYANRVMVSSDLEYDENGKLPITNDFRIITLLNNPTFRDKEEDENEEHSESFSQLTKLTLNSGWVGSFNEDDDIVGLTSGATAKVVSISETGVLSIINVKGNFVPSETIKDGDVHAVVNSVEEPDLIRDTGNFVYIDYRKPISRAEDQKEKIRIILQF